MESSLSTAQTTALRKATTSHARKHSLPIVVSDLNDLKLKEKDNAATIWFVLHTIASFAPRRARCLPGRWLAQRAILAEAPSR